MKNENYAATQNYFLTSEPSQSWHSTIQKLFLSLFMSQQIVEAWMRRASFMGKLGLHLFNVLLRKFNARNNAQIATPKMRQQNSEICIRSAIMRQMEKFSPLSEAFREFMKTLSLLALSRIKSCRIEIS